MKQKPARFVYRLYGLVIASEMEFPGLSAAPEWKVPDVVISFGAAPRSLNNVIASGPIWQTDGNAFLLHVPETASYLIANGETIIVDPLPGIEPSDLNVYLFGTAIGVLLHQRGILPLHASSVEVNGKAFAFAGISGAGKSTLIAHLHRRGYRVLSDDITAVTFSARKQALVQPGFPRVKLWADALEHIEHDPEELIRDHSGLDKYHFSLRNDLPDNPLPLAEIYFLHDNITGQGVDFDSLDNIAATFMLIQNSYKPRMLNGMGRKKDNFQQCAAVANNVCAMILNRPKVIGMMDELIDTLERRWEGLV